MPARKFKMDFANVKEGPNFRPRRKPEGDYIGRVVKVDDHTSREGNEGFVLTVKLKGDERSTYPIYASHEESQAWKVRKLFIAAGLAVPKKLVMVDPNKLNNKDIGVVLADDEYEGRLKSVIDDFLPVEDVQPSDEDDDDEKPARRRAKAADPEEDDDEEVEEDEEPEPKPRKRAASSRRRREPEPEDDEDDDDEEPAPRRRRASKGTTTRRRRARDEEDDTDDDLDLEEL